RGLFHRQKGLEPFLLSSIFEWTVDDSGFDGTTEQRGETCVRTAGDRLQSDVFVGIQTVSAKQLVNRKVRRAAETVDGDPLAFERFDAVDVRSGHDGITARFSSRSDNFHRQATRGGAGDKRQDSHIVELIGQQRAEHQVCSLELALTNRTPFFFIEPFSRGDRVRKRSPTRAAGPANVHELGVSGVGGRRSSYNE